MIDLGTGCARSSHQASLTSQQQQQDQLADGSLFSIAARALTMQGEKQEMIDIIETVFRGASKGRGLVVSPKDYSTRYRY